MIRQFLYSFFRGRNGLDALAKCTWVLTFVFILLSLIHGVVGVVCYFLAMGFMLYTLFRVLSRNVYKRSQENSRFLERTGGIRRFIADRRVRFAQRKEYKFFRCPTCHTYLRVPRGKGKLQITCRKCGNRFSGKT